MASLQPSAPARVVSLVHITHAQSAAPAQPAPARSRIIDLSKITRASDAVDQVLEMFMAQDEELEAELSEEETRFDHVAPSERAACRDRGTR